MLKRFSFICAIAGALTCASLASAGPLGSDPTAIPGFHGTQNFNNAGGQFVVAVDYAVYAPGTYVGIDPGTGLPPAAGQYVYAYQVFNNSAAQEVVTVSVGYDATSVVINSAGNDPTHFLLGGVPSDLVDIGPDSVTAFYVNGGSGLAHGTYSQVWVYTSAYAPDFASASVDNPNFSEQRILPSPIPEPATISLLLLAGLRMTRRRA